ncbi:MAG: helix-turn-helix transcriptional regulator [Rhizomicrobium sp.]
MSQVPPIVPYPVLVGQIIQSHRDQLGLHQSQIATAIGLSRSAYSRIESGDTSMTLSQLRPVARSLGLAPSQLLAEADNYASQLEASGVSVPDVKAVNPAALLIGLGLLAALIAATSG